MAFECMLMGKALHYSQLTMCKSAAVGMMVLVATSGRKASNDLAKITGLRTLALLAPGRGDVVLGCIARDRV